MSDSIEQQEYRVLARKYRPQVFADLIGQETLVKTLSNAISTNRIAHAYLLTGVRGIGKTTTARLIAMSLNCETRPLDSFEPCGKCDSCITIRTDYNMDVIEMDAASRTGVDDIREIINNVKYKPVNCRYKIFIIDEVHMLSKSAFNALLKTLEEPPPHIKFIFATTEVKKIPITIISRCQRFDLHRVGTTILTNHLNSIAKKEEIKINQDALALIVRSADGSVRDGLSLLDQAIANKKDQITANSVMLMLGLADRGNIFDLMEAIFKGEAITSLEIYNRIYQAGADVVMIFDEMLKVTHFLTQMKISSDIKEDIHIPELERSRGAEMAEKISMSSLGMIWQILFKGYQELQSGFQLFQHGEMLIIRLIYLYKGPTPEDLIKKLENNIEINEHQNESSKSSLTTNQLSDTVNYNKEAVKKSEEIENKVKLSNVLSINSFRQFVDLFYQKREGILHTLLYNSVKIVSFKEGEITINTEAITDPHFTRTIAKFVSKWTGRIWQISTSSSNIGKTLYEEDLLNQQKEIEIMKNDSEIKQILKKYSDVKIHSITNIEETLDETITSDDIQQIKEK